MSERKVQHWLRAGEGDQLHLTDEETLSECLEGIVVTIENVQEISGNLNHRIIELCNEQIVIVQYFEDDFTIYLCEPCNELTGNRENIPFMFNEDDSYVDWLDSPSGVRFDQLPMGEMTYELNDEDGAIATVVQYSSDEAGDLILIEWDNVFNPNHDGGYIDGYMAQAIKLTDIELYGV